MTVFEEYKKKHTSGENPKTTKSEEVVAKDYVPDERLRNLGVQGCTLDTPLVTVQPINLYHRAIYHIPRRNSLTTTQIWCTK